jgi:hypothetical protein
MSSSAPIEFPKKVAKTGGIKKIVALPLTVGIDMGLQSGVPMVKSNFPCH